MPVVRALEITLLVANFLRNTNRHQAAIEFWKELLTLVNLTGQSSSPNELNIVIYIALASAYLHVGNYGDSKANAKRALGVSKQTRNKHGELACYSLLSAVFGKLCQYDKTVKYLEKVLQISIEIGDKDEEAETSHKLGLLHSLLGEFEKATEYALKSIKTSKEIGNRKSEAISLSHLGGLFDRLGNFKESVQKLEEALRISQEIGGDAFRASILLYLGAVFEKNYQFDKAMEHYQNSLRLSQQIHDIKHEGGAYRHLGQLLILLEDYHEAISYLDKALTGDSIEKEDVCILFVQAYFAIGQRDKAMEYTRQVTKSIDNGGARKFKPRSFSLPKLALSYSAHFGGDIQTSCDFLAESVSYYENECEILSDNHKISVGDQIENNLLYKFYCIFLLGLGRDRDALCALERGRARVLRELLTKKYAIQEKATSIQDYLDDLIGSLTKEQILVYTAFLIKNDTVFWVMSNNNDPTLKMASREDSHVNDVLDDLLESILHGNFRSLADGRNTECEDRSLSAFYDPVSSADDKEESRKGEHLVESDDEGDKATKTANRLYNMLIAPFADITDIKGREVVLVPEGSMFMVPFSSLQNDSGQYLCDICKIRILPSLTTLKLIYDCPADYHSNAGALIVGDPNVSQVPRLNPLPAARQEAKEIADFLNVTPLLGGQATKEEVLRRIPDVCLIHIAAHGDAERGEIACAPNPSLSRVPSKEDFMLTMEDISKVGIRAKLVVLSCCHSGRGKVMKSEGVVGIARAFIASGARSVLVSLWLLNDESTKEFMIRFYMHLVCDKLSASEALHQAIKWMRQSKNYNDVRHWAPFVLIGDDVKLDF